MSIRALFLREFSSAEITESYYVHDSIADKLQSKLTPQKPYTAISYIHVDCNGITLNTRSIFIPRWVTSQAFGQSHNGLSVREIVV